MKDSAEYVVKLRAESVHEENSQQAHDTKAVRNWLKEIQLAMDIGHVVTTFFDGSNPLHPSPAGTLKDSMASYTVPSDLSFLVYFSNTETGPDLCRTFDDKPFPAHVLRGVH